MDNNKPITIHVHLVSGVTRVFHQDNPELIAKICNDLDARIFDRSTLVIENKDSAVAFAGHGLLGISIITDEIPNVVSMRENSLRTYVRQISKADFNLLLEKNLPKVEGLRSNIVSEIAFVNGQTIYLEFSEIAVGGMGERAEMHHLFTNPLLACRRLGGGVSLWNTARIMSWSHSPKLESPGNAWSAIEAFEAAGPPPKVFSLL